MTLTLGCGQSYSTSKFIVDVQKETRLMYIRLRIRAYRMFYLYERPTLVGCRTMRETCERGVADRSRMGYNHLLLWHSTPIDTMKTHDSK